MPAAISQTLRETLWTAAQQGLGTTALAEQFRLSARTVRHLLQQARSHGGHMPTPGYRSVRPADLDSASVVFRTVWALKQQHPDWGARFLLGVLRQTLPGQPLPAERTLRRWLQQHQPAAPPGRRPQRPARAQRPHQRWQIDACDQMTLANGTAISWLRGVDECTGLVLGTQVFPLRPVQSSASGARAGALPPVVRPVGPARGGASGQWLSLGRLV